MVEFTVSSLSVVSLMLVFLVALIGINQYLLFSISSSTSRASPITGGVAQVQQPSSTSIPSGETNYGVVFSQQGYDQLIGYQKSITLTSDQQSKYQQLIMQIPHECCNGAIGQCECGHAVALKGLVKLLLQKGYTDQQIKDEAYKWRQLFFSQNYPM
jgi:hypothetical protein